MTPNPSPQQARIEKIVSILMEEGLTQYLWSQFGVTLEKEAWTIDAVRSHPSGAEDLSGYLQGALSGADPEHIDRVARRIIDEVQ